MLDWHRADRDTVLIVGRVPSVPERDEDEVLRGSETIGMYSAAISATKEALGGFAGPAESLPVGAHREYVECRSREHLKGRFGQLVGGQDDIVRLFGSAPGDDRQGIIAVTQWIIAKIHEKFHVRKDYL